MASEIPVYPVLNRTLRDRIRFTVLEDYTFFYTDSLGSVNLLEAEDMSTGATVCNLLDNKGEWDPDTCDFHIRRQMLLQNTGCLFGEGGITGKEATLGVALIWASADSRQRGAVRLGEITSKAGDTIIDLSADFQPAQFRGRFFISRTSAMSMKMRCTWPEFQVPFWENWISSVCCLMERDPYSRYMR